MKGNFLIGICYLLLCTFGHGKGKSLDPSLENCNEIPDSCGSVCPPPGFLQSFAGGKPNPPSCDAQGACHCNIELPVDSKQNYCAPTTQEMSSCQCQGGSTIETPFIYHGKKCDDTSGPKYCVCFRATRNSVSEKEALL